MVKGRLTLSVERMDGKGDCMECPISMMDLGEDYDDEVRWYCPVLGSFDEWLKCPMEFVEVEE